MCPGKSFSLLIICIFSVMCEVEGSMTNENDQLKVGRKIILSEKENNFNEFLMQVKWIERVEVFNREFWKRTDQFGDFLQTLKNSTLFRILHQMPKGGVLHAHDLGLGSTEYLLWLTYHDNLWTCQGQEEKNGENHFKLFELKFLLNRPSQPIAGDCDWKLLAQVRKDFGERDVDGYLRCKFSVCDGRMFLDSGAAWKKFKEIFGFVKGLLTYEPVWRAYYKNALQEYNDDGVQYLEFRTTLPRLYALNGTYFPQMHTAQVYHDALQEFLAETPSFIGSKFIYAPLSWNNSSRVDDHVQFVNELNERFPNFIAGFDLLTRGRRSLLDFASQLSNLSPDIRLYFLANRDNNDLILTTDQNAEDAINHYRVKRIAHGYALMNAGQMLDAVKDANIAVEIRPISNKIFHLVDDFPSVSSANFLARNDIPVVITSEDPTFWGATPLTHDFYIAFLGIALNDSDLRLLKALAINSIRYSAMNGREMEVALAKWEAKWESFIRIFF